MADTFTATVGVSEVIALYDGLGNATGLQVKYQRVITDVTTGQSWTVQRGPFVLDPATKPTLMAAILAGMPSPGAGT